MIVLACEHFLKFVLLQSESYSVAQIVLIDPLASAALSARSSFLRCECYRLLGLLYNPKINPKASDLDKEALRKTEENGVKVISSICQTLDDEEMQKAKRVKEVLKATEKVLLFAKANSCSFSNLSELSKVMSKLDSKLSNPSVHKAVEKLETTIEALKSGDNGNNEEDAEMGETTGENDNAGGKKDKKKKKKKKRGKK